jgi:hypothetical protein
VYDIRATLNASEKACSEILAIPGLSVLAFLDVYECSWDPKPQLTREILAHCVRWLEPLDRLHRFNAVVQRLGRAAQHHPEQYQCIYKRRAVWKDRKDGSQATDAVSSRFGASNMGPDADVQQVLCADLISSTYWLIREDSDEILVPKTYGSLFRTVAEDYTRPW